MFSNLDSFNNNNANNNDDDHFGHNNSNNMWDTNKDNNIRNDKIKSGLNVVSSFLKICYKIL
jgi:hypothetical protein